MCYLKDWRVANGWTQKELCEILNVPQSTMCTYEQDASNMPFWFISKLDQLNSSAILKQQFSVNALFGKQPTYEIKQDYIKLKSENEKLKDHILKSLEII